MMVLEGIWSELPPPYPQGRFGMALILRPLTEKHKLIVQIIIQGEVTILTLLFSYVKLKNSKAIVNRTKQIEWIMNPVNRGEFVGQNKCRVDS